MEHEGAVEAASALTDLSGKYLTFELASEVYGLEILKVQEIMGLMEVTKVPKLPDYVRGVINLRGKVIPVIELRLKFDMDTTEDTDRTCIIVVQVATESHDVTMGIIVDEVKEVLDIQQNQIEPTPSFGTSVNTSFIMGMGKTEENVIMLLDVDKVLTMLELEEIAKG